MAVRYWEYQWVWLFHVAQNLQLNGYTQPGTTFQSSLFSVIYAGPVEVWVKPMGWSPEFDNRDLSQRSAHIRSQPILHTTGAKHLQLILTPVTESAAPSLPVAEIGQSLRVTAATESSRKVVEICWVFKLYEHTLFHLIFKIQQILTECHHRAWIMLGARV